MKAESDNLVVAGYLFAFQFITAIMRGPVSTDKVIRAEPSKDLQQESFNVSVRSFEQLSNLMAGVSEVELNSKIRGQLSVRETDQGIEVVVRDQHTKLFEIKADGTVLCNRTDKSAEEFLSQLKDLNSYQRLELLLQDDKEREFTLDDSATLIIKRQREKDEQEGDFGLQITHSKREPIFLSYKDQEKPQTGSPEYDSKMEQVEKCLMEAEGSVRREIIDSLLKGNFSDIFSAPNGTEVTLIRTEQQYVYLFSSSSWGKEPITINPDRQIKDNPYGINIDKLLKELANSRLRQPG